MTELTTTARMGASDWVLSHVARKQRQRETNNKTYKNKYKNHNSMQEEEQGMH